MHPFVDGNGRTARALFYWYLLKHGYASFEYLPISRIFLSGPSKYATAYLYTETDSGDLTYFIHYNLRSIIRAIRELHAYLETQTALLREAIELVDNHPELNYRQLDLVKHAVHEPNDVYHAKSHAGKYRVTFPTARTDLAGLESAGLLVSFKRGRTTYYRPPDDLVAQLKAAEKARKEMFDKPKKPTVHTIKKKSPDSPADEE